MDAITVKIKILKTEKTFLTHVQRLPQPKIQVPSAKNSTSSPQKDKKKKTHQNGRLYHKNQNFENRKKNFSYSCPKVSSTKKLGSQLKKCDLQPANRHKKHTKMAAIIVKIKILEIGKKPFLLMSQGVINQKIIFLAQKLRPPAREQDIFII